MHRKPERFATHTEGFPQADAGAERDLTTSLSHFDGHEVSESSHHKAKVSLASPIDPAGPVPGIVFVNGLTSGGPIRFIYSFDNGPSISTEPISATDAVAVPPAPFANKFFSVTVVNDTTNATILPTRVATDLIIAALIIIEVPISPFSSLLSPVSLPRIPYPETFLYFINLNDPSSPYRYLFIDGNFVEDVSRQYGFSQFAFPLFLTREPVFPWAFFYQLCNSSTLRDNCQSFQAPDLQTVLPYEAVIVMFSPVRQIQYTAYSPPSPTVNVSFVNSYYGIDSNVGNSNASQLIFEPNSFFNPSDLLQFEQENDLPLTNLTSSYFGGIHNTTDFCIDCVFADFAMEILTSFSQYPTKTYLFHGENSSTYAEAVTWIQYLANLTNPPMVIVINFPATEETWPKSSSELFNIEAIKVYTMTFTFSLKRSLGWSKGCDYHLYKWVEWCGIF